MGGFAGALTATIAVCIPSFLIIYLISLFFDQFLSLTLVAKAFLSGVRPCVVALILSTGITMLLESLLQITTDRRCHFPQSARYPDLRSTACCRLSVCEMQEKATSPILLILLSAILGLVFC